MVLSAFNHAAVLLLGLATLASCSLVRPPADADVAVCACFAVQMAFLSLLSLVQSLVVWVGLAAGLVYCVWGSSRGRVSVGDTVLFISMMQQLYVPLTFFGSYYRQVGQWAHVHSMSSGIRVNGMDVSLFMVVGVIA